MENLVSITSLAEKMPGIFGGLTYAVPNYPLKILAEYNPDEYNFQVRRGSKPPDTPYSFGLEWELFEDLHLAANYKHNNEFGFKISASLNTKQTTPKYPERFYKSTLDMKKEEFPEGYNPFKLV